VSSDLYFDAQRDLSDCGASAIEVTPLQKQSYAPLKMESGVLYTTYSSLVARQTSSKRSRLQQIVKWCGGADYEGLLGKPRSVQYNVQSAQITTLAPRSHPHIFLFIVFDECHRAKNLISAGGGAAYRSRTGEAVLELQSAMPHARVVYCSATGASEPRNMAYMSRLGLWGVGTAFPGSAEEDDGIKGFPGFLSTLERRGMAAMELVATDLKRMGAYVCRSLSYEGAEFELVEEILDEKWERMYDDAAKFWLQLRQLLADAVEKYPDGQPDKKLGLGGKYDHESSGGGMWADDWITDSDSSDDGENPDADDDEEPKRGNAAKKKGKAGKKKSKKLAPKVVWRYFWSSHQRFFRHLCVAAKVPCVVRLTQQATSEGKCVVIGMQSTGEARTLEMVNRAANASANADGDSTEMEDFVSAPRATLETMVRSVWPLPPKPAAVLRKEAHERAAKIAALHAVKAGERRQSRKPKVSYVEVGVEDEGFTSEEEELVVQEVGDEDDEDDEDKFAALLEQDALWKTEGHEWIGEQVLRVFKDTGMSTQAKITKWMPANLEVEDEPALWHIVHDDGDEEDLEEHEVLEAMENLVKQTEERRQRAGGKFDQEDEVDVKVLTHVPHINTHARSLIFIRMLILSYLSL
jgi:hypothetical protein